MKRHNCFYHELYDLVNNATDEDTDEAWDILRQWLHRYSSSSSSDKGRSNLMRFKIAARYQGEDKRTALHCLLGDYPEHNTPIDVAETLIRYAPEVARMKDTRGLLPLHYACVGYNKCPQVMKLLVQAFPEGLRQMCMDGWLPIHEACGNGASLEVLNILIQAFPQSIHVHTRDGIPSSLLLRHAWEKHGGWELEEEEDADDDEEEDNDDEGDEDNHNEHDSVESISSHNGDDNQDDGEELMEYNSLADDDEQPLKNTKHLFFLHKATSDRLSLCLIKLLSQAFPKSCKTQDENGMVPLHHALSKIDPSFMFFVMILVEASPESTFLKDSQGRTPSQLLQKFASKQISDGKYLLHYLAEHPRILLTENLLPLIVHANPDSLAIKDNYGKLPFHYSCLNPNSSIEVLMLFIKLSPESLLVME